MFPLRLNVSLGSASGNEVDCFPRDLSLSDLNVTCLSEYFSLFILFFVFCPNTDVYLPLSRQTA